ncbi:DUF1904 family protein [Tuanshanicoccus lijuaniae]|uniref:DUF1904 family protein n=1 Tax=Aerococcaceae bacterium zg-1292 TaxID=2774330 RepID=UPI0019353CCF|nr:DUF1904 family protein [Aerococcaceae bacterium zg-1292]QQA36277.1 DUF1904 family protein [Aerococcaceae bacterium zg-1292]
MPQLIFKGLKTQEVAQLSATLPSILSRLTDTPEDYFTFELVTSTFFNQGKQVEMYPLVEIKQFNRGLAIEQKMAEVIQAAVYSFDYSECEVYFTHIEPENYYE